MILVLSSFKKLVLRNVVCGSDQFQSAVFFHTIVPETIVRDGKTSKLKNIAEFYILDGFVINYYLTYDKTPKTSSVIILGGIHPNANTDTRLFCLPPFMKYKILDNQYIIDLKKVIQVWNLDNCHFVPNQNDYEVNKSWLKKLR